MFYQFWQVKKGLKLEGHFEERDLYHEEQKKCQIMWVQQFPFWKILLE